MDMLDAMVQDAGAGMGSALKEGHSPGSPGVTRRASAFVQIPARLQGVARARDAVEIPVAMIQPDSDHLREEFDPESIDLLADSLRCRGQLQPIRVRWDEGPGAYVIVCGERRWRAAVEAGITTLLCVVHQGPIAPSELLLLRLVENLLREDLKPIEQARAFRLLMEQKGWSGRRLAAALGIDQSGVVRALALLGLPEEVQEVVEQGILPPATAYEVSKLDHPDDQSELAARAVAEGLTRGEVIEVVRERNHPLTNGKDHGATMPQVLTASIHQTRTGPRVSLHYKFGLTPELMLSALNEVILSIRGKPADPGR